MCEGKQRECRGCPGRRCAGGALCTPRHPLGTTNRFLPRQDLPTDPEALSALVAARFDSASTTGIIDLRHLGTPEALAGLPGLATMVYVADVRHNGLLSVPAPVLGLPQLVVLNASDNAIEEVAEGEGGRVPLVGCVWGEQGGGCREGADGAGLIAAYGTECERV